MNPYKVVRDFEIAVAEYCGAPFAVSCTSCTSAILLACAWFKSKGWEGDVCIPKYTYIGVPMSIKHAGFNVIFRDQMWSGEYCLTPLPLYDSARRMTSDMYRPGNMQCLSLHWSKILGVQQGGVILLDDPEAVAWLKKARFDGRTEGVAPQDDTFDVLGYHVYLSPEVAAAGLVRLSLLPKHNQHLVWDNYPDLSKLELFK